MLLPLVLAGSVCSFELLLTDTACQSENRSHHTVEGTNMSSQVSAAVSKCLVSANIEMMKSGSVTYLPWKSVLH